MRIPPLEAADQFVQRHFPDAALAVLGGSTAHGEGTSHSDLDLVIIDDRVEYPFRRCYYELGWPIETFVLSSDDYSDFLEICAITGLPTLARMCAKGIVIKDAGRALKYVEEARHIMEKGPDPLTEEEINRARYEITEYLDDLAGSGNGRENVFTVQQMAVAVAKFILRAHGQWIGEGKWLIRSLCQYDPQIGEALIEALDCFYEKKKKGPLIDFVEQSMRPFGGKLFQGYEETVGG